MPNSVVDPHALILTPTGRDSDVAGALLAEITIASRVETSLPGLVTALANNVLFVIVTEEELRTSDLRSLAEWVRQQESWSDLAFILLTRHGGGQEQNPAAARISEILGNVIFIERPFHATTFLSVVKTALRGRRRQYEARATLEALRESGERLQTALVAGRLGAWELDLETMELTSSDACKAVFGRSRDQVFSYSDLLRAIHPDDLTRMQKSVRETIDTGSDYAIEYRTVWPDGSQHWAEIRARLVRSRGQVRMVGVSSDVTSRKSAEDSLRNENETLEARVRSRTRELELAHRATLEQITQRELAESKLRQSQKLEMIGKLTGGIAHDFNNLLMAVLGNLDLLKRQLDSDPRAARLVDGALQGARRGAALTQRLLAFARQQDLSTSVVDLSELVRGMKHLIERTIGTAIDLRFEFPMTPLRVEVDTNQVELALLNLVINACHAMPDGGVLSIEVDQTTVQDAGQMQRSFARLAVRDTGHGMDKATLERAAEPFFSTKDVGKGTGLGLSMVHGLVEQLGGRFLLASEVGKGTTAELLFPETDREVFQPKTMKPQEPVAQKPSRLHILLVDDDVLIAMSSVAMLEDLGHEVQGAYSGEAALTVLQQDENVDLLITDFSMPRMNGSQLAKAAREIRPDLPIILATGYAELPPGVEINLPKLNKPYDQRQLAMQIKATMGSSKSP